jgi:predicted nucleic acid-binding protein
VKYIVDTCVWSRALRRSKDELDPKFHKLLEDGAVVMIGPIRQEILCGIKNQRQFNKLKTKLDAFLDAKIIKDDYISAAQYFNECRSKGIQGSMIDFLITAVSVRHKFRIHTYDKDFQLYEKTLELKIL